MLVYKSTGKGYVFKSAAGAHIGHDKGHNVIEMMPIGGCLVTEKSSKAGMMLKMPLCVNSFTRHDNLLPVPYKPLLPTMCMILGLL